MTGTGAHPSGGRWNSPWHHAIYTSGSLSLAMLELLVHIDDAEEFIRTPHIYQQVSFPESAVATLDEADLPEGWDSRPEPTTAQVAGDEWLESLLTPVLAVPSVVIPSELRYDPTYLNYLVNPKHPDFATAIAAGDSRDLTWDPRLAPRTRS